MRLAWRTAGGGHAGRSSRRRAQGLDVR